MALRDRIDDTLLEYRKRKRMSDSQNSLREFYKTNVILMLKSLTKTLKELQQELIEEIQEMLNIFESMKQIVEEKSPKDNIFQNEIDRLLEVSLTREIQDCVLISVEEQKNKLLKDEIEKNSISVVIKCDTKKEDEQSQTKRKYCNASESINEQPNKRMCKAEKFEAIQYSLGTNEEYIAIRRCEYDIWDDLTITSKEACRAYQEIFRMMDEGWMVTRTETLEAKNIDEYWWRIYKSRDLEVLES
ncbi:hypothetical protein Tco_0484229 [Tanacetum coccineum]